MMKNKFVNILMSQVLLIIIGSIGMYFTYDHLQSVFKVHKSDASFTLHFDDTDVPIQMDTLKIRINKNQGKDGKDIFIVKTYFDKLPKGTFKFMLPEHFIFLPKKSREQGVELSLARKQYGELWHFYEFSKDYESKPGGMTQVFEADIFDEDFSEIKFTSTIYTSGVSTPVILEFAHMNDSELLDIFPKPHQTNYHRNEFRFPAPEFSHSLNANEVGFVLLDRHGSYTRDSRLLNYGVFLGIFSSLIVGAFVKITENMIAPT